MRRGIHRLTAAGVAVAALLLASCGDDADSDADVATAAPTTTAPATTGAPATTAAGAATTVAGGDSTAPGTGAGSGTGNECTAGKTLEEGTLTIATGNLAYEPWVVGDDPESGEGFEAAVAYAIATELGFDHDHVVWVRTGFDEAVQPGDKSFDFNLQQFSITPEREEAVSFSHPYYSTTQAIVAGPDSPAVGATTVADLADVKFGVQAGTTSLQFITDVIRPSSDPYVYDTNEDAKAALAANQIDAIVADVPTALYISAVELEGTSVVGQFPQVEGQPHDDFGLLFDKDNPLVECVDVAVDALTASGALQDLADQWLTDPSTIPVIAIA